MKIRKFYINRIHIAFQGPEVERISYPIIQIKADRAYIFIFQDESTEKFIKQYHLIEKQLKESNIEVVQKGVNIHNYIEIIQNISKIIKSEREENPNTEIFINLSVGTKLTAIAAMDACRFWDCIPYYVIAEHYISELEVTKNTIALSSGKMEIFQPPIFKLNKPKPNIIEALKIIAVKEGGIHKKEFRKKLLAKNLLKIQKKYDDPKDPNKLSAEYMAMNHQYLKPLQDEWEYIHVSDARRNQKITLTELGEEAVQIFKYLS
ncbi:MAG: hypothetical protein HWN65_07020 [Candidatus Helarchaeota archaeon]|nr:hypothetical protein [Candidatus Helarchaeota archaeon]